MIKNDIEITDQLKIQYELRMFYEELFKKTICNANSKIVKDELLISLNSTQNNKTPGNDGLTKEFYETFWNEIKHDFLKSLKQAKEKGQLNISQRQAVIKLTEKKR